MKRIMAVLVILLMATALLFAGGGNQSSSAAGALTSSGKLVVEMFDRGTDGGRSPATDNAWTNWIKDKVKKDLNIDVTFQAVGRWSEPTDMTNLMAAKSAPDLCYSYSDGMINNFRDWGGILNLAPYIDTYLPDLKKLLGDDPVFPGKDFIRRDNITTGGTGAIYKIASQRVALAQRNIFIRKDWLDALNMKVPTNINEFHDALVAFRDRDPGKVGANRVIPYFQGSDVRWGLADLINNSLQKGLSDRDIWINSLSRTLSMPGYKDGVKVMNQWYNEKLIYQDFPLLTVAEDGNNILKSGVAGAFGANWDLPYRTDYNINAELAKNVPGASFIAIDINLANKAKMDKTGLYMFIPAFSKSQKEALQYLNWLAKFENFNYLQIGERGRNHNLVDGVPQVIPATGAWIQNSAQNIDITMPLNGVYIGSDADNAKVLALTYPGTPSATIVSAYAISVKDARAPIVHPATLKVNQYTQVIEDKGDALLAQAIRATPAQFDSVWDTGYRDWLTSGAQAVIDERTSQWPK